MDQVIKRGWLLLAAIGFVVASAAPALAHAERSASTPEEGERVQEAPGEVSVTFTEPPIADADFKVFDGCKNDVVEELDVQNMDITAALSKGQPGKWRVAFHVVSGIDGHATKESFAFTVAGSKDCSAAESPPPSSEGPDEPEDSGVSMGLIAMFAGGTVLLVIVALMLRGKKS